MYNFICIEIRYKTNREFEVDSHFNEGRNIGIWILSIDLRCREEIEIICKNWHLASEDEKLWSIWGRQYRYQWYHRWQAAIFRSFHSFAQQNARKYQRAEVEELQPQLNWWRRLFLIWWNRRIGTKGTKRKKGKIG
jgi:hypothetical protein